MEGSNPPAGSGELIACKSYATVARTAVSKTSPEKPSPYASSTSSVSSAATASRTRSSQEPSKEEVRTMSAITMSSESAESVARSPESVDFTQRDDSDFLASSIITRLIANMRSRHLVDDEARVILMRRGETLSDVFPDWTVKAFDSQRNYVPCDLNMPTILRKRERLSDFLMDPPLTNISLHFAYQLGYSMLQNLPTVIYTSPEMASVQTAKVFMDGIDVGMSWYIEPGLAAYYPAGTPGPKFTSRLQHETVYRIERINELIGRETLDKFHQRIAKVIRNLKFPTEATTVIVAEAVVIDSIIQTFIRFGTPLTKKQLATLTSRIPCLSMMHFDINSDGRWKPSCASLPGLLSSSAGLSTLPDLTFLVRPTTDF